MQISFLLQQYTKKCNCMVSMGAHHLGWPGLNQDLLSKITKWYMYIQITAKSLFNWDFVVRLMHCDPSDLDPDLDYPKGTHPVLWMYM